MHIFAVRYVRSFYSTRVSEHMDKTYLLYHSIRQEWHECLDIIIKFACAFHVRMWFLCFLLILVPVGCYFFFVMSKLRRLLCDRAGLLRNRITLYG